MAELSDSSFADGEESQVIVNLCGSQFEATTLFMEVLGLQALGFQVKVGSHSLKLAYTQPSQLCNDKLLCRFRQTMHEVGNMYELELTDDIPHRFQCIQVKDETKQVVLYYGKHEFGLIVQDVQLWLAETIKRHSLDFTTVYKLGKQQLVGLVKLDDGSNEEEE